jgi:hypothetical protein
MLRFYISIKNNLMISVVIKKLLWSQNREPICCVWGEPTVPRLQAQGLEDWKRHGSLQGHDLQVNTHIGHL